MMAITIKICGLKDPENIREIVSLRPDYMGFILHRNSPRYVDIDSLSGVLVNIPSGIKKVGVLVNEPLLKAIELAKSGLFDFLQLHGDEEPAYCNELLQYTRIIKAFRISTSLPANLDDYMDACVFFLFDTAGGSYGGTGQKFDHSILQDYSFGKKFMLSGGISPSDALSLQNFNQAKLAGIDLNSKFETSPGIKNIILLKTFIEDIRRNNNVR